MSEYHVVLVDRLNGETSSQDVTSKIESAFDLVKSLHGEGFTYQGYDQHVKKGDATFKRLEFAKVVNMGENRRVITCLVYRQISGFGESVSWWI